MWEERIAEGRERGCWLFAFERTVGRIAGGLGEGKLGCLACVAGVEVGWCGCGGAPASLATDGYPRAIPVQFSLTF